MADTMTPSEAWASMGPPSMNGGRDAPSRQTPPAMPLASMGPPSMNGGRVPGENRTREQIAGFNGAAVDERRKDKHSANHGDESKQCFNGAAVDERRKDAQRRRYRVHLIELQWGRRR